MRNGGSTCSSFLKGLTFTAEEYEVGAGRMEYLEMVCVCVRWSLWVVCLCVCMTMCVTLCLSIPMCGYVCTYLCVYPGLCVSLRVL